MRERGLPLRTGRLRLCGPGRPRRARRRRRRRPRRGGGAVPERKRPGETRDAAEGEASRVLQKAVGQFCCGAGLELFPGEKLRLAAKRNRPLRPHRHLLAEGLLGPRVRRRGRRAGVGGAAALCLREETRAVGDGAAGEAWLGGDCERRVLPLGCVDGLRMRIRDSKDRPSDESVACVF